MTLAPGTRLGVYEVVAQIGAGGMGEVNQRSVLGGIELCRTLYGVVADLVEYRSRRPVNFVADKPRVWSEKQIGGGANGTRNVDLTPDGKRVVALMPVETAETQKAQNQVIFLENFFDEVRRKVPIGK